MANDESAQEALKRIGTMGLEQKPDGSLIYKSNGQPVTKKDCALIIGTYLHETVIRSIPEK